MNYEMEEAAGLSNYSVVSVEFMVWWVKMASWNMKEVERLKMNKY